MDGERSVRLKTAITTITQDWWREMKASETCETAAALIDGPRNDSHGDKQKNFDNIARMWNAYFATLGEGPCLTGDKVAVMMVLLKVARTTSGDHNDDDYIDMTGYAAIAGELVDS